MLPKNFSHKSFQNLLGMQIPEITEPYHVVTHWINIHTSSFEGSHITSKLHRHTYFELHIILNGTALYGLEDGSEVTIPRGNALLIPPGVRHIVKKHSDAVFKFSIAFSPDSDDKIYKVLNSESVQNFPVSKKILDAVSAIFAEKDNSNIFSDVIIKGRLIEIYSSLPGASAIPQDNISFRISDIRLENALRYISDNISANLTCREIASHCGISTKQLSRIFAKHLGKLPLEYIHSEKFREAQNLLKSTDLTIREISEQLGFANEYYFNTFFTRQCGIPPGSFRKNKF